MLRRSIFFLKRYLLRHPLYVLVYSFFYWRPNGIAKVTFLDREAVARAVRQGKSIIRYGDGEINLFLGINNHYQKYTPVLADDLKNIIRQVSATSPYLVAVPRFLNWSNGELQVINRKHLWLPFKVFYTLLFPKNIGYLDAHSFYYDNYFETVVAPALADVPVIIMTSGSNLARLRLNKKLPWSEVRYIECPAYDAYEVLLELEKRLDAELATLSVRPVILIALGPVGKCLAFAYSHKGYQCIDIGRGIERIYTDISLEQFVL